MSKEITSHDSYFAKNLSRKEIACDFLKSYLPECFKKFIDFESIKLENGNTRLIGETAKRFRVADLLYSVKLDEKKVFLLVHVEHQSTPNKLMPIRIMNYTSSIWLDYNHLHPDEPLPPIISFVYYHGAQKPYPFSMKMLDLFENLTPEQKKQIETPILIDLSKYDDNSLTKHGAMSPVDALMKHTFDPPTHPLISNLFQELKKGDSQTRVLGVDYILSNYDLPVEEFIEIALENFNKGEFMTVKQRIEERSARQASEQIARKSLVKGLDVETVADITGLDINVVKKIKETLH